MAAKSSDFAELLRSSFKERQEKNPRYSVRAFARALEMDFSLLAKLLKGQRRASLSLKKQIGPKLGMSLHDLDALARETSPRQRSRNYRKISLKTFSPLSKWYYLAMLELSHLPHFKADPHWIAKALGLPVAMVRAAIVTLRRCGFLTVTPSGVWQDLSGRHLSLLPKDRTHSILQNYQKQMLQQSMDSLKKVSVAERDHTAMTFCVDKDRLLEAKEKIKRFRRELDTFLSEGGGDEVYCLTVSLFPLSHSQESNNGGLVK